MGETTKRLNELTERFNLIKNKLHVKTMKNNDFVAILDEVYRISPVYADKMWREIVTMNEKESIDGTCRNIYLVYTKMMNRTNLDDAMLLLTMDPHRVDVLLLHYYGDIGYLTYQIIEFLLRNDRLQQAVHTFTLFEKRIEIGERECQPLFDYTITICQRLKQLRFRDQRIDNERLTIFMDQVIATAKDKSICQAIQILESISSGVVFDSSSDAYKTFEKIKNANKVSLCVEFLFLERSLFREELEQLLILLFDSHYYMLSSYDSGYGCFSPENAKTLKRWLLDLILSSETLLKMAYTKSDFDFGRCETELLELKVEGKWDFLYQCLFLGLSCNEKELRHYYSQFVEKLVSITEKFSGEELIYENGRWYRSIKINNAITLDVPYYEDIEPIVVKNEVVMRFPRPVSRFYVGREIKEIVVSLLTELANCIKDTTEAANIVSLTNRLSQLE